MIAINLLQNISAVSASSHFGMETILNLLSATNNDSRLRKALEALHLTSQEVSRLSPASLQSAARTPLLTIVGRAETAKLFRQPDLLIANWSGLLPQIDRHVEPDFDYIDLIDSLPHPAARCSGASSTGCNRTLRPATDKKKPGQIRAFLSYE